MINKNSSVLSFRVLYRSFSVTQMAHRDTNYLRVVQSIVIISQSMDCGIIFDCQFIFQINFKANFVFTLNCLWDQTRHWNISPLCIQTKQLISYISTAKERSKYSWLSEPRGILFSFTSYVLESFSSSRHGFAVSTCTVCVHPVCMQ